MITRIGIAGGGTGGHMYPLLAVAEELKKTGGDRVRLVYFGDAGNPLAEEFGYRDIPVRHIASSKLRRYFSVRNIFDGPRFVWSVFQALAALYSEMPDAVFSKGGPGALAVVLAARFYMIPVIVHESDAIPGLTTNLTARFAEKVLLAFPEAAAYFPADKTVVTGNPVRKLFESSYYDVKGIKKGFGLDPEKPVLFVVGGSQGSARINDFVTGHLEELLAETQILHQTGTANYPEIETQLKQGAFGPVTEGYKPAGFLSLEQMKQALTVADVVLSRAGAGGIFEIAACGKPAIVVPLEGSANGHQKANAYAYAACGAARVVEESNLSPNLVLMLLRGILREGKESMAAAAKAFYKPSAAKDIAETVLAAAKFVKGDIFS